MPSLASHDPSTYIKLLLLGDSKAGKTTSLASLTAAGYNLRILDLDNLLGPLAGRIRSTGSDLTTVEYRSIRDTYKSSDRGTILDGKPKAWINALKMLDNWRYTDDHTGDLIDLGPPRTWDPDCILVIDSLSRLCDAAYNFHEDVAAGKDGRMIYGNAQDYVEKVLAGLTSDTYTCNVIVVCHGVYMDLDTGGKKIFPQGVGQKLSPKIPQYFPNYIQLVYDATTYKRIFRTTSNRMINLASSATVPSELPADTGLATFFAALRSQPQPNPGATQTQRPTIKPITLAAKR